MKILELDPGFTWEMMEMKCPHCGKLPSQDLDATVNQISTNEIQDNTGNAEATFEACAMPKFAVRWYKMIKASVTFPFSAKEKDSAKRNKQSRIRR